MKNFKIVFVTSPVTESEKIAKTVVENKLAACANIVKNINSFYWWENKVQNDTEDLIIFKTQKSKLKKLIKKGYVKIKYLNRKKLQYILTPKGFAEKLKKSYSYAKKVISEFTNYSNKLSQYIISEYEKGNKNFTVKCNSD